MTTTANGAADPRGGTSFEPSPAVDEMSVSPGQPSVTAAAREPHSTAERPTAGWLVLRQDSQLGRDSVWGPQTPASAPAWLPTAVLEQSGVIAWSACLASDLWTRLREISPAVIVSWWAPLDLEDLTVDPVEELRLLRQSGYAGPVLLVTPWPIDAAAAVCIELNADYAVLSEGLNSPGLPAVIRRAVERILTARRASELEQRWARHQEREQRDAEQLLRQQRAMLESWQRLGVSANPGATEPPTMVALTSPDHSSVMGRDAPIAEGSPASRSEIANSAMASSAAIGSESSPALNTAYQALLRSYLLRAPGELDPQLPVLINELVALEVPPAGLLALHSAAVVGLLPGLGERSRRHVATRAELLILELMCGLAEAYRRRALGG